MSSLRVVLPYSFFLSLFVLSIHDDRRILDPKLAKQRANLAMELRLQRGKRADDMTQHCREPIQQRRELEKKLMMKRHERLSTVDGVCLARETGKIASEFGEDDAVVVLIFSVALEDDGPGALADGNEVEEGGQDEVAKLVLL